MLSTTSSPDDEKFQAKLEDRKAMICHGIYDPFLDGMEIPARYRGRSLANFDPHRCPIPLDELKKSIVEGQSLFIRGHAGAGKTHLAVALMGHWFAEKYSGKLPRPRALFLSVSDLLWNLKRTFDDVGTDTAADIIERYASVSLLAIDDLGANKITEWSRGDVLYPLIDRRYREMLPTIITSNLTIAQISELLDDRIASRIVEMGMVMELRGGDERIARASSIQQ
jgi:DNA replication protein DnaC